MKVSLLICIFLCGPYLGLANRQPADSLFAVGNYEAAAVGYEKDFFLSFETVDKKRALLFKSFCYKALGEYDHAYDIVKRGINIGEKDSIELLLRYEAIVDSYLAKKPSKVLSEIKLYEFYFPKESMNNNAITILNLLALNDLAEWNESKQLLLTKRNMFGVDSLAVEELYKPSTRVKLKNPQKAYNISLLLPGVGQMYAGHFFKGLFSSTVQAALMTFSITSLYDGYFFSGGVSGMSAFYAFYVGGADYSKKLTEKRNDSRIRDTNLIVNSALLDTMSPK